MSTTIPIIMRKPEKLPILGNFSTKPDFVGANPSQKRKFTLHEMEREIEDNLDILDFKLTAKRRQKIEKMGNSVEKFLILEDGTNDSSVMYEGSYLANANLDQPFRYVLMKVVEKPSSVAGGPKSHQVEVFPIGDVVDFEPPNLAGNDKSFDEVNHEHQVKTVHMKKFLEKYLTPLASVVEESSSGDRSELEFVNDDDIVRCNALNGEGFSRADDEEAHIVLDENKLLVDEVNFATTHEEVEMDDDEDGKNAKSKKKKSVSKSNLFDFDSDDEDEENDEADDLEESEESSNVSKSKELLPSAAETMDAKYELAKLSQESQLKSQQKVLPPTTPYYKAGNKLIGINSSNMKSISTPSNPKGTAVSSSTSNNGETNGNAEDSNISNNQAPSSSEGFDFSSITIDYALLIKDFVVNRGGKVPMNDDGLKEVNN